MPLHIVTGFLGVGKTTAILNILEKLGTAERVAVVINEWGTVSIDAPVVSSRFSGLAVREVSGGCICCTLGAALDSTLEEVLEHIAPDRIIIEPSGVAKPGDIVDLLWGCPCAGRVELRPIIGLVDPVRFGQPRMMAMPIYRDQVEAAQILVANRCDVSPPESVEAFLHAAAELFPPKAALLTARFGELPLTVLELPTPAGIGPIQQGSGTTLISSACEENQEVPYREAGWIWSADRVFSLRKLETLLETLASGASVTMLKVERGKAIFHTDQGWRLMEIASGGFSQREIQYRVDNRCQLIAETLYDGDLQRLESAFNACVKES